MHGDHREAEEASGADRKWVQLQWGQLRGGIWSTGTWPTHAGQVNIITPFRTQFFTFLLNLYCFSAPITPCALAQIYICTFILYFYHMIAKQLLWCPCLSFVGKRGEVSCSFVMWAESNIRRISKWLPARSSLPPWLNSDLPCYFTLAWGWLLSSLLRCWSCMI